MSWLNFNDSLNNIKGQLSNFANTVLADEIGIQKTADNSNEAEQKLENKVPDNVFDRGDSWTWSTDESKTDQLKTDETITNLKKRILELENENRELMTSLDQLDQNHQQNTEELVKMKGKLDEELEIVTEKYEILNMKYNKLALAENAYKKKINELKIKYDELSNEKGVINQKKDENEAILKYKQLEQENIQLTKKLTVLENANQSLEMMLQDTNSVIDSKLSEMTSAMQQLEMENKALRIAVHTKTESSSTNEEQKVLKEQEKKIAELEEKLKENLANHEEDIQELNRKLENSNRDKMEIEKRCEDLEKLQKQAEISSIEDKDQMRFKFEEQMKELEDKLSQLQTRENDNKQEEPLKESSSLKEVHRMYFEILNNSFKEYFPNNELCFDENVEDDLLPTKFIELSKTICNILNELELKCNSLESKLFELNQNKTDLQNEKNDEIEKLIQNSEMLTQELLKKSKEIKDLEDECSQLMKNNDLLIGKLEESRDAGLQTIFESNEDNVALLEKQLDVSNRKIEELEEVLAEIDCKNQKCTVVNQSETPNDIQDSNKNIMEDYNSLKILNGELQQKLDQVISERDNCRVVIDKMKLDFETTEYQFSEMNINLETLSEEIEKHKVRIDSLVLENENLKSLKNDSMRSDEELNSLRNELNCAIEKNKKLETVFAEIELKWKEEIQKGKEVRVALDNSLNENGSLTEQIECTSRELQELFKQLQERENESFHLQNSVSTICKCLGIEQDSFDPDEILRKICEIKDELRIMKEDNLQLNSDVSSLKKYENDFVILRDTHRSICEILQIPVDSVGTIEITQSITEIKNQLESVKADNTRLNSELKELQNKLSSSISNEAAQKELNELITSRNELISIVQTKHQETLTYHAEIQRLSEILKNETEKNIRLESKIQELETNSCPAEMLRSKDEEIEKLTDQKSFLEQKCDVLAKNMLEEQRNVENEKKMSSEREGVLSKKLERLQGHLMEVEEHYTQELLSSEQKIALLQARLNEVEQREKDSSTIYTSVSIRANQQNEALQQQLQSMTNQRDEFKKKLMDLEDDNNVKSAALSNLQLVLEQFQRDKEADVMRETDRIRRQVRQEQKIQEELRREIANLENQIRENKQGLQAALRLTDQLEISKNQISTLKEEVTVLTDKLNKKEEELKTVVSQTDGKVDKSLIKNLIIGFIISNKNLNKDQTQILKIIATVLDFNEQDHSKVNSSQGQQSNWLKSLLSPVGGEDLPPNESLSRAFVHFLENESKPRVIPSLLPVNNPNENASSQISSSRTTPSPIVLNEIVLPTFSDFPQHRNSSSILKGVLKDNP